MHKMGLFGVFTGHSMSQMGLFGVVTGHLMSLFDRAFIFIIVKKLNSLKHLVRTTVAKSHN